jgi:hypothetical protein
MKIIKINLWNQGRPNQERRESKLWSCDSRAALIVHDVTVLVTMHLEDKLAICA